MMKKTAPIGLLCFLLVCAVLCTSCSVLDSLINGIPDGPSHDHGSDEPPLSLICRHQFDDWKVSKAATCLENGERSRTCKLCGGREKQTVSATGHRETAMSDVPATCTLPGSLGGTCCEVCDQALTPPTVLLPAGHPSYQNGICTSCGSLQNSSEGLAYLDLYNQTHGYEFLGTMENGSVRQELYRQMDTVARRFHTDPSANATKRSGKYDPVADTLKYGELGLTLDDALEIWKTYRDDNPLYYWLSTTVVYDEDAGTVTLLVYEQYASGKDRMEMNKTVYQGIAAYLSVIPPEASDYEIALLMHDRIIDSIEYARDASGAPELSEWAHNIVGVFDGRGSVCEGYARAYQLLLNFKGVDCLLVTGYGKNEPHAWNMVRIGEEWYGVDVTWDDNNVNTYAYFCQSEADFYQTHDKATPADTGVEFLYEVPELAEYTIEWVELYLDETALGLFPCIDIAFEEMTDPNGNYTLRLLEEGGELLHPTESYHIYGSFPRVDSLTVIGVYTPLANNRYTATVVYLTRNVCLQGDLTLKNLFLMGMTNVTLTQGSYVLQYGTNPYHSALKNGVYLA